MIVRRLMRWFASSLTSLRDLLYGTSDEDEPTTAPTYTMIGAQRAALHTPTAPNTPHTPERWLDDGRRLRPETPLRNGPPPADAEPRDATRLSRPLAKPLDAPLLDTPAPAAPALPSQIPSHQSADIQPPAQSGATALEDGQPPESDPETQRSLIFLRYLVRQRVYNEGFSGPATPEQYRRSVGMDE